MNMLLQKIHDVGVIAWLRFVQFLNWAMLGLAAALVMVHQVYPQLVTNLISKTSPYVGIPLIIGFCLLVHWSLRQAKKAV